MNDYNKYKSEDFIDDFSFIQWVIEPTEESNHFWKTYIKNNPKKKSEIEEAIFFIRNSKPQRSFLPEEEKFYLWEGILSGIKAVKFNKNKNYIKYSIAASVAVLLSISIVFWYFKNLSVEINYSDLKESVGSIENTRVILADESTINIKDDESSVLYSKDGKLILNNNQILDSVVSFTKRNQGEDAMNQLIVPNGRRANICFMDGTRLWLNSGSHAIYPVNFSHTKREIYIEGEAYLEVAKNENWPFIVKTKEIDIRVLGTSFNVNAYEGEEIASVVLVEGSVEIKGEFKKIKLEPNQLYKYNMNSRKSEIRTDINILEFIGWKDGWLLCNKEPLHSLFQKLERYYNINILIENKNIENYTTSGKLELKENVEDVFNVISLTAPINYRIRNDSIFIRDEN